MKKIRYFAPAVQILSYIHSDVGAVVEVAGLYGKHDTSYKWSLLESFACSLLQVPLFSNHNILFVLDASICRCVRYFNHPLHQCLSQDLETGCLKLAVVKYLGVQIFKGDHNILIFQP